VARQGESHEPISSLPAVGMIELRICVEYVLRHGEKHLVHSGWLPDTPQGRSLLDEMAANAQAMDALVRWWIEQREVEPAKGGKRASPRERPGLRQRLRASPWHPTKDVLH
jgi:hypothetical protein